MGRSLFVSLEAKTDAARRVSHESQAGESWEPLSRITTSGENRCRNWSDVANQVRDPDQDDSTDGRDDDPFDPSVGPRNAECTEYPSADETSDQAEYEITD